VEHIKRKIFLEGVTSRRPDKTNGSITATTFDIIIPLHQEIDNMGVFTDVNVATSTPEYTLLVNKLTTNGHTFPFMSGITPSYTNTESFTGNTRLDNRPLSDWFKGGSTISATTESRVSELRSYNRNNRYIVGFNVGSGTYVNYSGSNVNYVSKILSIADEEYKYVFDTINDANIGTPNQSTGLLYVDNILGEEIGEGLLRGYNDYNKILATVQFKSEGWNVTNSSLSAITKEEHLLGIINEPEVFSDVFIDRGVTTATEMLLRLSEVKSVEHLDNYGNGFFNVIKI